MLWLRVRPTAGADVIAIFPKPRPESTILNMILKCGEPACGRRS